MTPSEGTEFGSRTTIAQARVRGLHSDAEGSGLTVGELFTGNGRCEHAGELACDDAGAVEED